ncbi:DUF3108 domain-containing protein [Oleiharenicola sp. Vm1]|uniref:DUF3108 domain-containing protein n=1 Tax=Oleiharenicola sp. Vm1 TaxID=3398393 RepID=UPI0039F5FCED
MRFRLLLVLLLSSLSLGAAPFTGMVDGERFTYKVGFAIFPHAGDIVISAQAEKSPEGRALMRVTTVTASRGLVRGLYEFDNVANVLIDVASGRALSVHETGEDPKRKTDSETIFDYEKRIAHYVDRGRPERSTDIPIPEGDPIDLISALVQTRDWNLKPGEKRDVLMHFGRDLYALSIYAEGYEEVRTPLGKFKTLVLVPRMEKDPKGLFKRGGEIKVWIAQDGSRLPVRMQLKLKFGTASLLMTKYEPPAK